MRTSWLIVAIFMDSSDEGRSLVRENDGRPQNGPPRQESIAGKVNLRQLTGFKPLLALLGRNTGRVLRPISLGLALPGLGQLFYTAVMARDYPLIMGNLVLGAVLTLGGNLLADLGYGLADPRIRHGGGK